MFVDGFINNETSMSLTRAFVFCFSAFSLSFLLFVMLMNKLEDKSIREPKEEREFTPLHVLPHSIIIGVKKCGTRAIITMLEDIFQDVKILVKEPWFFSQPSDIPSTRPRCRSDHDHDHSVTTLYYVARCKVRGHDV